jgi:hypothetical protein
VDSPNVHAVATLFRGLSYVQAIGDYEEYCLSFHNGYCICFNSVPAWSGCKANNCHINNYFVYIFFVSNYYIDILQNKKGQVVSDFYVYYWQKVLLNGSLAGGVRYEKMICKTPTCPTEPILCVLNK